jgi:hypothetical protein
VSAMARVASLLLLVSACTPAAPGRFVDGPRPPDDEREDVFVDNDGDGYEPARDCDDADPSVHAGAPELCDGLDNDCDDQIDEDVEDRTWYRDGDGDGYGDPDNTIEACAPPDGYVVNPGDCNDGSNLVHPGALRDGVDADCDGRIEWHVTIVLTVDDAYTLCVDDAGNVIGEDDEWEDAETYRVWLDAGEHVIGFLGEDDDDIAAAALAEVGISRGDRWWTNGNWRFDPEPQEGSGRAGWCSPGFDDGEWGSAHVYGPWGVPPYGFDPPELAGTAANWIWDNLPYAHRTQYFRLSLDLPNTAEPEDG